MLPNLSSLELVPTAVTGRERAALAARVAALPTRCAREATVRDWMAARIAAGKIPRPEEPAMFVFPLELMAFVLEQSPEPIDRLTALLATLPYTRTPLDQLDAATKTFLKNTRELVGAAKLLGFYEDDTKSITGLEAKRRVSIITQVYLPEEGASCNSLFNSRKTLCVTVTKETSTKGRLDAFWLLVNNGCLPSLEYLTFACASTKPLFDAIGSGSMANLKVLDLGRNQIGHEGMKAFAATIASGSMANLQELYLHHNQIGDAGMVAFAAAMGSLAKLEVLYLRMNKIGDVGMAAFANAITASGSMANLQELFLHHNQIGDAGMAAFSNAITSGSLASLQMLVLNNNPGYDAMFAFATGRLRALLRH